MPDKSESRLMQYIDHSFSQFVCQNRLTIEGIVERNKEGNRHFQNMRVNGRGMLNTFPSYSTQHQTANIKHMV